MSPTQTTSDVDHTFLQTLMDQKKPVAIFLRNGIKLTGQITSFDKHAILLNNVTTQMIYKDAISTIMPLS